MGFRITTNMMMNTYRYNLMNNTNRLADARDMVMTQRTFSNYYDDPAAATQAFRLRRDYCQTANQLSNTTNAYGKFHTAWTSIGKVVDDLSDRTARVSAILGANGTAGESRTALGQVLSETAESVVQIMNNQLGDQFIFAGNDGLNVPFSWSTDGKLLYRGVNVNAGAVAKPDAAAVPTDPAEATMVADWQNDVATSGGTYPANLPDKMDDAWSDETKAWYSYYSDQHDLAKLQAMEKEEQNLDLGMGLKEDADDKVIPGSAFNVALSGIKFIGYGVDENGLPNNMAVAMKELGEIFSRCSLNDEKWNFDSAEDESRAYALMDKLKANQEECTSMYTELDAKSKYLKTNESRLGDQKTNLNEQILGLEKVDLADAITSFSWEQYCYNAALKIGNQLLSQSLIDYMR